MSAFFPLWLFGMLLKRFGFLLPEGKVAGGGRL